MKLYTSYFSKVRALPEGTVPISISLWPPKGYAGAQLRCLAPTKEILTKYKQDGDWAAYVEKYEKDVLGKLRQETIMQEITRLSGGKDAAILCFERDPAQCHRSLVARWLRKAGYKIAEYGA